MIRRPPRSTLFPYNDALPIYHCVRRAQRADEVDRPAQSAQRGEGHDRGAGIAARPQRHRRDAWRGGGDRKSTRLNSSHLVISYVVFCLKKKIDAHLLLYLVSS